MLETPLDHIPAARRACMGRPKSAAWFDARAKGITATDISALTGRNRWQTPLDVWKAKTEPQRDKYLNEAAEWGGTLEPAIIRRYARDHKPVTVWRPHRFGSVLESRNTPIALASLDAIGKRPNQTEVIEAKTAGTRAAPYWEGEAVPVQYAEQVQWQMLVTGLPVARVCVLLAGQTYEERVVWSDPIWQEAALDLAQEWWNTHITGDLMPAPTVADADHMPTLWTPKPKTIVEIPGDLWDKYHAAKQAADDADEAATAARIRIQTIMGPADTAQVDGETVVTWRAVKGRTSLDRDKLEADHPNLLETYMKRGNAGRRFAEPRTKAKK